MTGTKNVTGLYLSGFIQEGYLPPQERKSTIPSTLYRGHVVKLARRANSNPHRSSVGRYPMHSLNAGFNGLTVPVKDQMYFKIPDKMKHSPFKAHGKWTNYPMAIEIRKVAGHGASASYLAECVLGGSPSPLTVEDNSQRPTSRISSMFGGTTVYRDQDEEIFYRSMYNEIKQVVANQEDAMAVSRHKLQRILMNNSENMILPRVSSPARESKRAATSYGYLKKPHSPKSPSLSKRPYTTANAKATKENSLLLPVPYVSQCAISKQKSVGATVDRLSMFSPWLPKVSTAVSPREKLGDRSQGNIGVSSAQRLNKLLNAAALDVSIPSPSFIRKERDLDQVASCGEISHSALSVVVPALGKESPSLPCSPQPPLISTPPPSSRDEGTLDLEANQEIAATKTVTIVSPKVTNVTLFSEPEDTGQTE